MSERKNSVQTTLNIFGFVFIVLGLGLEGGIAFALLGLAVGFFVAALVVAAARLADNDSSGG